VFALVVLDPAFHKRKAVASWVPSATKWGSLPHTAAAYLQNEAVVEAAAKDQFRRRTHSNEREQSVKGLAVRGGSRSLTVGRVRRNTPHIADRSPSLGHHLSDSVFLTPPLHR